MTNPEHGSAGMGDRENLMVKLKELVKQIFSQKARAEAEMKRRAKKEEEEQEKRHKHESREKRAEEKERRDEADEERVYHRTKSADVEEVQAGLAREQRANEVWGKVRGLLGNGQSEPEGSFYLVEKIRQDANIQTALRDLISTSPVAAEVVNNLVSRGVELHGNARALIKEGQKLLYEADKAGKLPEVRELLALISARAQDLAWEEYVVNQKLNRKRGYQTTSTMADLLADDSGIVMDSEDRKDLSTPVYDGNRLDEAQTQEKWRQAIDRLVASPKGRDEEAARSIERVMKTPDSSMVAKELLAPLDEIWGEVELKGATPGSTMSIEDLERYRRRIQEDAAKIHPKEIPGSQAYDQAVQAIRGSTEDKLNELARSLEARLRQERPTVKEGIVDEKEFIQQMVLNKGRMGQLFDHNPEIRKRFLGLDEKSRKFRDKVFIAIHSAVLSDKRNSSGDNFGLYERADFTTFTDILRIGLDKHYVEKTGEPLGQAWSDYYNNLSNAIRQSRDIDFWASQPASSIENFNKALGMFQNEYITHAMMFPAVNAAFRAYETTLRSIMDSNDGYIPPGLIEYSAPNTGAYWDQQSLAMLRGWINAGVIKDFERDERTQFHVVDEDGHTVKLSESPLSLTDVSEDELNMYMTLAKGMGLVNARYLEIFANSRVPGSEQPERALEGFHSMAYEGVARALNYFSTYVYKWKIGGDKFFYLFNQLVPSERKISDSKEAIKAFMAYQDGTFEDVYGKDAKRFIDLLNFSGISSAIGKDTTWRQFDMTSIWPDKKREFLGGPTQLVLAGRYAEESAKRFLVINKYREEYRKELIRRNQAEGVKFAVSGGGFEKLWQEYGRHKFQAVIDKEWDRLNGKHPAKGTEHTPIAEQTHHLVGAYEKAFKARVWVEMAMRNPLVVAHNLKIDVPLVGYEDKKKQLNLHNLLVQEILEIPPEDMKYGELYGKTALDRTPTEREKRYMAQVLQLETDLAAVRERAIQDARDLTEADFHQVIRDGARRDNALRYWRRVRQVILGTDNLEQAEHLYEEFGMGLTDNGEDYEWDYEKIHHLFAKDGQMEALQKEHAKGVDKLKLNDGREVILPFLLRKAVESKPEWILGTDDMSFNRMDMLNLGSRNWLRRGGDIAAHWNGGAAAVEYMRDGLVQNPDKHELAKLLKKVVVAYSDDMVEIGWSVAGNFAYLTDRFYAWDPKRLGSSAQRDVWESRRNVAGWLANGRREFWDALEHADVIPPHGHFYHYKIPDNADIHKLRDLCHAKNEDVWLEIVTLGVLLAMAITIWRALSAKDEEEGGGGGHH